MTLHINIVANNAAPHQMLAANAMCSGFTRHGIAASIVPQAAAARSNVVVCWGGRQLRRLSTGARRVLVIEAGYVGDRGMVSKGLLAWYSLAWDGLNGRGKAPPVDDGGARWERNFSGLMKPWRNGGEAVIVVGQVPGDAAIEGVNIDHWYRNAVAAAQRLGNLVFFRPHPVALERGYQYNAASFGVKVRNGPLDEALATAKVVITFNSNCAVNAVVEGVPAIVCDQGSMAWPVAAHELGAQPIRPDRSKWAMEIAWRQWRLNEIESGEAWDYLKQGVM